MIIPDSNIIIDFWRSGDETIANVFRTQQIVLCGIIRTELLRGAHSIKEFDDIKQALAGFEVFDMGLGDWDELGWELSQLRSHGVTVPFQDALIAHLAMKHSAAVWTRDKHFSYMQNVLGGLHLFSPDETSPLENV
ncbi:MAG: PIN domain-containing protein [Lachnospiraceae bacterium]|nr:PIN domain-containing protein [Lachnospiraceae bacterium]